MASGALQEKVRPLDPNVKQRIASNPDYNIWVNASAGTGKTKVLTDRVLRLLLPRDDGREGSDPHKVLCITFTKAGASEMILRVQDTLARWVVMPLDAPEGQKSLRVELQQLLGQPPSPAQIEAARGLFNLVIDLPGGLEIMTIHAFCQSVLARFPLEAGIAPHMIMLEDDQAQALLRQAITRIYQQAGQEKSSALAHALDGIARSVNEEQFMQLLRAMLSERDTLEALLRTHFGVEGLYASLCEDHGLDAARTVEGCLTDAVQDDAFDRPALHAVCLALLESDKVSDQNSGQLLDQFLAASSVQERVSLFEAYSRLYFTADGSIRKKLCTQGVEKKCPGALEHLQREAERLFAVRDVLCSLQNCQLTRDLLLLGEAIIKAYNALKAERGALDFDDQILKTLGLLRRNAAWVLYKLDRGIDHILVDEAQDTNPEQWQIVEALCQEFYAHEKGQAETNRTIFVVGDEKQSIYGFQRASPEKFSQMRDALQARVQAAGQVWHNVDLQVSFRSTPAVLSVVDQVFAPDLMRAGVSRSVVEHHAYRRRQAGVVELWPLYETQDSQQGDDLWAASLQVSDYETGSLRLAKDIAARIRGWLDEGEVLPSRGRALRAGDIMVLVRTRTIFVYQLMRALKALDIPVSGADRLILSEDIAVRDLLAAAEFCLLPEDDLTLACLLKSPLLGLREDDLFALAYGREGSLWESLCQKAQYQGVASYLKQLRQWAQKDRPFEFLNRILLMPCPASSFSGFVAMKNRLGEDVADPVQELLNQALDFERSHIPALQRFCDWMSRHATEIKRENDAAADEVRIMTVHGSKGLQAPVVIMPDTVRSAAGGGGGQKMGERLLWPDKTGLRAPLWSPRSAQAHQLYKDKQQILQQRQQEEDKRLLYVAMTRAEDRLYIAGHVGKTKPAPACWYAYIAQAFEAHPWMQARADGVQRIETLQDGPPDRVKAGQALDTGVAQAAPDWLFTPVKIERPAPRPFAPSRDDEGLYALAHDEAARTQDISGALSRDQAITRGQVTHKLLELLPVLPAARRRDAALAYLKTQQQSLPETVCQVIFDEVFALLDHPAYAAFFSESALAEVPIVAQLPDGRMLNGVIDRLYIDEACVWILDYKTGRNPPTQLEDVPPLYLAQMQAYRQAVRLLYPDHDIRTALLWTHGARLMELPAAQ